MQHNVTHIWMCAGSKYQSLSILHAPATPLTAVTPMPPSVGDELYRGCPCVSSMYSTKAALLGRTFGENMSKFAFLFGTHHNR